MPPRPMVIFYSNAVGEDLIAERGIVSDSPAATRKVAAVCRALKSAGVRPLVVSMARGRTGGETRSFDARCGRLEGIPVAYGPLRTGKLASLLATVLWLCRISLRLSRRKDAIHLFYNQLFLYLPALAALRFRRARTALDLEDGPIGGGYNPAHRGNAPGALFARFINNGALVACRALTEATTIRPTLAVYGAIPAGGRPKMPGDRDLLQVLYSGSIEPATGSDMLAAAVRILRNADIARPVRIHVTGAGIGLEALAACAGLDRGVEVRVHGRAPLDVYRDLLGECSVGLSLKLASGPFAQTTFPSKTIEYAEHGLVLIATDVSDVRTLFGSSALYIENDSPHALAEHLLWLASHPAERKEMIEAAYARLKNTVSHEVVGAALREFFFGNEKP
jgi:glycosyltransferase involved in cell wall biosynthesis